MRPTLAALMLPPTSVFGRLCEAGVGVCGCHSAVHLLATTIPSPSTDKLLIVDDVEKHRGGGSGFLTHPDLAKRYDRFFS